MKKTLETKQKKEEKWKFLLNKIFVFIGSFLLLGIWIFIFTEYLRNHQYYNWMIHSSKNWWLIIWSIVSAIIPILYLIYKKNITLKWFIISILTWTLIFWIAHVKLKWATFSSIWLIKLLFNNIFIFLLWLYFLLWTLSFWDFVSKKLIKFKNEWISELFINFWIWLWILLIILRFFIQLDIFHSTLVWTIFLSLWAFIYLQKDSLKRYSKLIISKLEVFYITNFKKNPFLIATIILIIFSLMYYYFWFQLSFIPYSTAWDANHAYMYLPKIWSLNNWVFRHNWPWWWNVWLWHAFIAFWFSFMKPLKWFFSLSPDNIAVSMNFLSWILVLLFTMWLLKQIWDFFIKNDTSKKISFHIWRFIMLLWLTSWMWAFLIFVDNKTDLWVMSMTILALLSGFVFLNNINTKKLNNNSLKYILISWFMFALAWLAKPTALIDVALFGALLAWLRFNRWITLWWLISVIWGLWILKFASAWEFFYKHWNAWTIVLIIWIIIVSFWILLMFYKNINTKDWLDKKLLLSKYFWLWILSFIMVVFLTKAPWVIYWKIIKNNLELWQMVKDIFLSKSNNKTLLADKDNIENLLKTKKSDLNFQSNRQTSLNSCKSINYTEEELNKNLKKPIVKNEDVGRYIWYWRKTIKKNNFWIWYPILHIFFKNDNCYAIIKSNRLMCEYKDAINNFDLDKLKELKNKLKQGSESYFLLENALNKAEKFKDNKNIKLKMNDEIINMRQYYESNSIFATNDEINIPYKSLIPLNIVYNRSLQNLSSYYTDIWFVRWLAYILIILALFYWLFSKNKKILTLTFSSLLWRAIRWIIWWWILRYGIWLIIWTTIIIASFTATLEDNNKKNEMWVVLPLIIIFILRWLIQFVLNFVRIASQWAWWPFLNYKMWVGTETILNDQLSQEKKDIKINAKKVFDMQFWHYNKIINYLKNRKNSDWILIAWTYLSYFLDNQHNLKADWMLSWFVKEISDWDLCKSYYRLKNNHIKYLAIDVNIWTVVMWEWNSSLFDRFFAKIDKITWKIQEDWAITMLVKFYKNWYLKLINTNNIWAKYAFILPDSEFKSYFWNISDDDIILIRAKMIALKFFRQDWRKLYNFIANEFNKRMANWNAILDIADVFWKEVDEEKLLKSAKYLIQNQFVKANIPSLSQNEKFILSQYFWIYRTYSSNPNKYQSIVMNIMSMSMWWWSQIIWLELK